MKWFIIFLGLLLIVPQTIKLPAQEGDTLDWDIDSIFDEPRQEVTNAEAKTDIDTKPAETPARKTEEPVTNMVKQRGFTFDASYIFAAGVGPGWYEAPWDPDATGDYYFERIVKMRNSIGMDAQISDVFRAKSTIYYEIPNFSFQLGDFFFDYSLYDVVFMRGGKYNLTWGISPNYRFTNLLVRIPDEKVYAHDSFIFKADIPAGIGGFQLLALTRADLLNKAEIKKRDIGFGGKFNLALRRVDMDLGGFYQEGMALRSFLSLKTTIGSTELYSEGLWAINVDKPSDMSGAVNLGFFQDFFDNKTGKFTVNAEVFYNAEKNAIWYRPESTLRDAEVAPFADGLNGALNLLYRFKGKGNFRFFIQTRYAPWHNSVQSAQLVPGFAFNPWPHMELYLAVPMALGSNEGYYYKYTIIRDDSKPTRPLPFSVSLMLTLRGSVKFGYYY